MRGMLTTLCLVALASTGAAQTSQTRTSETRLESASGQTYSVQMTSAVNGDAQALAVPREDAWRALVTVYQELGLEVHGVDTASTTLAVRAQRVRRRLAGRPLTTFFDCGSNMAGPIASSYTLFVSLTSRVSATPTGSQLETVAEAVARDPTSNSPPIACSTRGTLERRIAIEVQLR
jgi:hypothetical protein